MKKKSLKLKELFNRPGIIQVVGAHDGLSAKIVEKNGFDAIWASGFEISTSHAVPDASILTMSQYLERTCEMNEAVSIPVIADCDTGYGNSNNVIHMVKRYESAGIAAVCIEDKRFPKVNSLLCKGRQELAPIAEFVGKIMAAKNTQLSTEFMVIARVEAFVAGWGCEEAIKRADAYVEAGADAILVHSKAKSPDEIREFCQRWKHKVPVVIVPTTYPMITEEEIKRLGIKMVIYANHGIRSAIKAMDKTFAKIKKDRGIYGIKDDIAPLQTVFDIQGMVELKEHEKKYLKNGKEPANVIVLAAGKPTTQESLMPLLKDTPLIMLDINGKPLLQRNVETLRKTGFSNISVVVGYQKGKINLEGIEKIENDEFEKKHILESLMKAESKLTGKTLLCYGDIIFERLILFQLIDQEDDIVLLVDPSFKKVNIHNKKLDLVKTKNKPLIDKRSIPQKSNPVLEIGNYIPEDEADYEFIGIILFSQKGIENFKKEYYLAKAKYKRGRFRNAPSFDQAEIGDLLNEMIQKGYQIGSLEIDSGWMEIHSFEDYKKACRIKE
jgi:phosphoenolpyruvate phosphomutase